MKSVSLFFLIIKFFLTSCLAAQNLNDLDALEEIEYQAEKQQALIPDDEINFDNLKTLKKYDYHKAQIPKQSNTSGPPLPATKTEKKLFKAALKKGARLFSLDGKEGITTERLIYVQAGEEIVGEKIIYIYNKKGEIAFQTESHFVVPIEADLDMDKRPKVYKIESTKENLSQSEDKKLKTIHLLNYQTQRVYDPFSAAVFASYLNIHPNTYLTAHADVLEYQGYLPWKLPLDFGINLNYVAGSWKDQALGFHWRSVNIGPQIQKVFALDSFNPNIKLRSSFGVLKSLFFNISSDQVPSNIEFSSTSSRLSLEGLYSTSYGTFGIGPYYSLSKYSVITSDKEVKIDSKKETISTIGLSFLYIFEINL